MCVLIVAHSSSVLCVFNSTTQLPGRVYLIVAHSSQVMCALIVAHSSSVLYVFNSNTQLLGPTRSSQVVCI